VFALWIIAVDQCFVPSDNASQEITFSVTAIQKVLADIQAYTCVLLCGLLGNPHCTTLWKSFLLWMISWVELLSDVQMTCNFIGSGPAVIQNHGADLFSVLIRSGPSYRADILYHFCVFHIGPSYRADILYHFCVFHIMSEIVPPSMCSCVKKIHYG